MKNRKENKVLWHDYLSSSEPRNLQTTKFTFLCENIESRTYITWLYIYIYIYIYIIYILYIYIYIYYIYILRKRERERD